MFIVWLNCYSNQIYPMNIVLSLNSKIFLLKDKSIIKILLINLRINGSVTFDHQMATAEVHHEHVLNYFGLIMPISIKVAIVLSILMVE